MIWLLKTEPETYSFDRLEREKRTNWNDVRNHQARNFLRQATVGETALIYHSGDQKAVVGVARVSRAHYPDPDPETPGDWVQVDVEFARRLARPVALAELKADARLKGLPLIRQSRLSVMPITPAELARIEALAIAAPARLKPKPKPKPKPGLKPKPEPKSRSRLPK